MNNLQNRTELPRAARWLRVGAVALALLLVIGFFNPGRVFEGYLLGYLFWLGISLGALSILLLHHLTGGAWGFPIRRILESAVSLLPWMLLLFLPILLFGLDDLYTWARPEQVDHDPLLQHKQPYLNSGFFSARALIYFAVWIGLGSALTRWSRRQDMTDRPHPAARLTAVGGPGVVLYALVATFASIDWVMSLEPHWFSTMYGVLFAAGVALSGLSFAVVMLGKLSQEKPLSDFVDAQHFHDIGNLLLTFVMFWAYIAFSQFLIIWSGNLSEETPWYLNRSQGGWQWVAVLLALFHFAVPFALLLSREHKRRIERMQRVARLVLGMRVLEMLWLVTPAFSPGQFKLGVTEILALLGVGGLWMGWFARHLARAPLLPVHLPTATRLPVEEVAEHG